MKKMLTTLLTATMMGLCSITAFAAEPMTVEELVLDVTEDEEIDTDFKVAGEFSPHEPASEGSVMAGTFTDVSFLNGQIPKGMIALQGKLYMCLEEEGVPVIYQYREDTDTVNLMCKLTDHTIVSNLEPINGLVGMITRSTSGFELTTVDPDGWRPRYEVVDLPIPMASDDYGVWLFLDNQDNVTLRVSMAPRGSRNWSGLLNYRTLEFISEETPMQEVIHDTAITAVINGHRYYLMNSDGTVELAYVPCGDIESEIGDIVPRNMYTRGDLVATYNNRIIFTGEKVKYTDLALEIKNVKTGETYTPSSISYTANKNSGIGYMTIKKLKTSKSEKAIQKIFKDVPMSFAILKRELTPDNTEVKVNKKGKVTSLKFVNTFVNAKGKTVTKKYTVPKKQYFVVFDVITTGLACTNYEGEFTFR